MGENSRRWIIYGAGAIGGVVGGRLALGGNEVALIGRPGHMKAIRENGLKFTIPSGTHILRVEAVTSPSQVDFTPNDVVLLTVKGQDTDKAMRDLCEVVKDVPIFCIQNGVRNEETASKYFPRVYGVVVQCGCLFVKDGEVTGRWEPPGWFTMGRYPKGADDLVEEVAAKMRSIGFHVLVTPDVMPFKWGKLMANLANAIGAITNVQGDDYNRILEAARQEAREVLAQAGIRWVSEKELQQIWPERTIPTRHSLGTNAQSSTWQSLTRQQGTVETDFLNGEIVRVAKQVGKRVPINEAIIGIVKGMAAKRETPGKYTPTELLRLVGLE